MIGCMVFVRKWQPRSCLQTDKISLARKWNLIMRQTSYKTIHISTFLYTLARALKRYSRKTGVRILVVGGIALTLTTLVLYALESDAQFGRAHTRQSVSGAADADLYTSDVPAPVARDTESASTGALDVTADEVLIDLAVTTKSGDDNVVFNGEEITYTITITNNASDAVDVWLLDGLPERALENVQCQPELDCEEWTKDIVFEDPRGGTITVTITTHVSWTFTLAVSDTVQVILSAKVHGKADGSEVKNLVSGYYTLNGATRLFPDREVVTIVRVRVERDGVASLSSAPTWFSEDVGGTFSMDWGDFDGDGDLDLALGSSVGATIYENEAGGLKMLGNPLGKYAYGVRWADLNNDNQLELVAVGDSIDSTDPLTTGINYIYRLNEYGGFEELASFNSTYQLVRVAPGDYNGDGYLDLVASTNGIKVSCGVELYTNTWAINGQFFTGPGQCISEQATASVVPGDYDNDGDLDLILGRFPNQVRLVENVRDGTVLTASNPFSALLSLDDSLSFLPYDFAWGNYDGDNFLDLAAAFPLERKIRVYAKPDVSDDTGSWPYEEEIASSFLTPLSLDWGDLDGDGHIDLVVAGSPPVVYRYVEGQGFSRIESLSPTPYSGQVWSIPLVDHDNDGDIDLSLSNRDGPSMIFTTFAPFLKPTMDEVGKWAASSVAWGEDANSGDDYLDLLFGAGENQLNAQLCYNDREGHFDVSDCHQYMASGLGPQSVAFGDVNGDNDLDLAFGGVGAIKVYLADTLNEWIVFTPTHGIAWGDADDDGDLDLLASNSTANTIVLFVNQGGSGVNLEHTWSSDPTMADARYSTDEPSAVESSHRTQLAATIHHIYTRAVYLPIIVKNYGIPAPYDVAWGDFNGDRYLDFAVGDAGQPNSVYCNNRDNTFTLVWRSPHRADTRSVAWGDYDGDGDLDLAVGNYKGRNHVYQNTTCDDKDCVNWPFLDHELEHTCADSIDKLSALPVWSSDQFSQTTSLAWGDWDNDGDLDLAVGNYGEPDQVFANLSTPGAPQLKWLWTSQESYRTTGIAWGDRDNDGDLDLAVSQGGDDSNGVYENTYVMPSHLSDDFVETMPLPNVPSYLSVGQPGNTHKAYFFSSAELLSGPGEAVLINYTLFDPDGTRAANMAGSNLPGDPILATTFEFSLDGGGTWRTATPAVGSPSPVLTTTRLGYPATFLWDAVADQAISDNARFRVTIVQQNRNGPFQRASISAISPPFRVRGVYCTWPEGPSISVPDPPVPGQLAEFIVNLDNGGGLLTYFWDFGDGTDPEVTQESVIHHTFETSGTYDVRVAVRGEACPVRKEVFTIKSITVQ